MTPIKVLQDLARNATDEGIRLQAASTLLHNGYAGIGNEELDQKASCNSSTSERSIFASSKDAKALLGISEQEKPFTLLDQIQASQANVYAELGHIVEAVEKRLGTIVESEENTGIRRAGQLGNILDQQYDIESTIRAIRFRIDEV